MYLVVGGIEGTESGETNTETQSLGVGINSMGPYYEMIINIGIL